MSLIYRKVLFDFPLIVVFFQTVFYFLMTTIHLCFEGAHPKEIKDWCADLLVGFELTANRNPILFVTPPQRNENYCFIEFCNEVTMLAALELNGATLRNKPVRFDMTRGYKKKFLEEHRQRKGN